MMSFAFKNDEFCIINDELCFEKQLDTHEGYDPAGDLAAESSAVGFSEDLSEEPEPEQQQQSVAGNGSAQRWRQADRAVQASNTKTGTGQSSAGMYCNSGSLEAELHVRPFFQSRNIVASPNSFVLQQECNVCQLDSF